jgi:nucleotide-binding universal stress UspA family protein
MRLLIGYDGSESAEAALSDLRLAGLPRDGVALIVTVADTVSMPALSSYELVEQALVSRRVASGIIVAQTRAAQAFKEARDFASQARARVQTLFPEWDVRAEALAGNPAHELIGRANDWAPDLVVVGSHGKSAVGRLLLGSTSKKLVTDLTSSVRVVRRAPERRDDHVAPKIIIGVDGSTGAEQAIRSVGSRIWPNGTQVCLVAAEDGTSREMTGGFNDEAAVAARRMVEWADSELSAIGLRTSVVFGNGEPQRMLVDAAREWDADSIFVGSRNFNSAFERFRLGSVSTALATSAPCSVEVVR